MRRARKTRVAALPLVALLASLGLVMGCGSEDGGSPLAPVENPEQTLEENLGSFNTFNEAALDDPSNQLLDDPQLNDLMSQAGLELFVPTTSFIRDGVSAADRSQRPQLTMNKSNVRAPRVSVGEAAGTYDRDAADTTEPFPGWVLAEANNPSNGYVFRFQLEDGVTYWDEQTMTEVPVQGEFRLLEIMVDDGGTPSDPNDDYLEHMVVEIAASPDPGPAPTVARLEFSLTVTINAVTINIGSAAASNTSHPDASFVGPFLYYVHLSISESSTAASLNAIEQLYDSAQGFGARFETSMSFNVQTQMPSSAQFVFAAGATATPSAPPLRFELNFFNFRTEGFEEIADVSGSITFQGAPLATLSGDTTEVPVDLDGDGTNDGTCVNVDITFADNPGVSQNICEAVDSFDESLFPMTL